MLAPLLALLAAAPVSITNTQTVHDLAAFGNRVVACTEGGLDVFASDGRHLRTIHREDGLPSHACRALRVGGAELFAATDEGVAVVDRQLRVEEVLPFRWAALPPLGNDPRAELRRLGASIPAGPTYTAFSSRFAGTADGRVIRIDDGRVWSVPGPVLTLDEAPSGLRIGTAEGRFRLCAEGLVAEPRAGTGMPRYSHQGSEWSALASAGSRGQETAPTGRGLRFPDAPGAPDPNSIWLQAFGRTWTGTDHGVFTREGTRWVRRTPRHALCGNHITALTRFQGRLVVGTFDSGICWQEPSGGWTSFRTPALPSDHVLGLAADSHRLYVATEYGLGLWDGRHWHQFAIHGRNPFHFRRLSLLAAIPLSPTRIALADGAGISLIEDGRFERRIALPAGWAKHPSVVAAAGRFLWYGSEDRGLARFDGQAWAHFHDGRDLTDNWITALDADARGRAIAGTCQDGFNVFDGQRWHRVHSAPAMRTGDVTAVALTPGGALVGTLLGALHYDAATGELTALPDLADPHISAIRVEPDRVWFGTWGGLSSLAPEGRIAPPLAARR